MKKRLTYSLIGRRPIQMASFVVCAFAAALLTMATALSVTDFLQLIFPSSDGAGVSLSSSTANPVEKMLSGVYVWLAEQGQQKALILYSLLLIVLYGLKNVSSYLSAVSYAGVKNGVMCDVRNRLHWSALQQPFKNWSQQQQGQWLSLMSNDITEYETNVLDSLQLLVQSLLTMVIYIIMLLYLDWRMTLLVVVVMAVGAALLSVSRRLKRQSRHLQALNGEIMTTTQETIESLKEIKAAAAIDYVNERQKNQNRTFTRRRIGLYRRIYAASPISDFVGNCIVVAILVLGAHRVLGSAATLSPALFVSYIMIYVLLLTPIKELSNSIALMKKGRGVEERISEVLSSVTDEPAQQRMIYHPEIQDAVELRNVTFAYNQEPVIDNLSCKVSKGKWTAIVGESGSGKTTLGRLITGLLQPQKGEILVGGTSPEKEGVMSARIGYVPQEAMLFNDTIEANIRFGRDYIDDEAVHQAVHQAQLETLISQLPDGLATVIGDGGGRLSGGERQRVSIARALAGKPALIVMDEATAALDAATEQYLGDTLSETMGDSTLVMIAHRASTVARCDEVIRM